MGILASVSGAEFTPVFKYNVTQGRAYVVERQQGPSGWQSFDQEVAIPVKFVADLANMRIGQIYFPPNSRPDMRMVPIADLVAGTATMPERPSPEYRTSFIVRLYSKTLGMREWRAQQQCVLNAMDALYDAFVKSPEAKGDLVPVVEIAGVTPIRQEGQFPRTDMQPQMRIVQWVPRPEALPVPSSVSEPQPVEAAPPIPGAIFPPHNVTTLATRPNGGGPRPAAHVPPPRPSQQLVQAGNAMHAPSMPAPPPPPAGDDDAEFV